MESSCRWLRNITNNHGYSGLDPGQSRRWKRRDRQGQYQSWDKEDPVKEKSEPGRKREEFRTRTHVVCVVELSGDKGLHKGPKNPRWENLEGKIAQMESQWLQRTMFKLNSVYWSSVIRLLIFPPQESKNVKKWSDHTEMKIWSKFWLRNNLRYCSEHVTSVTRHDIYDFSPWIWVITWVEIP